MFQLREENTGEGFFIFTMYMSAPTSSNSPSVRPPIVYPQLTFAKQPLLLVWKNAKACAYSSILSRRLNLD